MAAGLIRFNVFAFLTSSFLNVSVSPLFRSFSYDALTHELFSVFCFFSVVLVFEFFDCCFQTVSCSQSGLGFDVYGKGTLSTCFVLFLSGVQITGVHYIWQY